MAERSIPQTEREREREYGSSIHDVREYVDYVLGKVSKGRSAFGREALAAAPAFRPMEYALHRLGDAYLQLRAFSLGLICNILEHSNHAAASFPPPNSPTRRSNQRGGRDKSFVLATDPKFLFQHFFRFQIFRAKGICYSLIYGMLCNITTRDDELSNFSN